MARKVEEPLPLQERVKAIRAEIDALIDKRAAEMKASRDGSCMPIGVLRSMVTKHSNCQCAVALRLLESK